MPCPLPQAMRHAALRSAIQRPCSGQGLGSRLATMVGNAQCRSSCIGCKARAQRRRGKQCAPRLHRARQGGGSLPCVSTGKSQMSAPPLPLLPSSPEPWQATAGRRQRGARKCSTQVLARAPRTLQQKQQENTWPAAPPPRTPKGLHQAMDVLPCLRIENFLHTGCHSTAPATSSTRSTMTCSPAQNRDSSVRSADRRQPQGSGLQRVTSSSCGDRTTRPRSQ